jgi:hypothetical protein
MKRAHSYLLLCLFFVYFLDIRLVFFLLVKSRKHGGEKGAQRQGEREDDFKENSTLSLSIYIYNAFQKYWATCRVVGGFST